MPQYLSAGDSHLVVEFGTTIDLGVNRQVHSLAGELKALSIKGVREVVPTYRSLMISFNPLMLSREDLIQRCEEIVARGDRAAGDVREVVEIPVLYGGEHGPDLPAVAATAGLSEEEVVRLHAANTYPIYMIGFMPGYPYLGGLDERIAVPRHKNPRTKVPAGSVAIAEKQTGVYPIASPGGWQLIGHTPIRLYRPEAMPPTLLSAGQYVRFRPVSPLEYAEITKQVERDAYVPLLKREGATR